MEHFAKIVFFAKFFSENASSYRSVATNSGLRGARFKSGPFLHEGGIEDSNVSSSC